MSINVAVLGATGLVGQKVIALLENHTKFCVSELASSRNGLTYEEACDWRESMPLPTHIGNKKLISVDEIESKFVISCLPGNIAEKIEPLLSENGKIVFSNASAFRMKENIPLLVPEINLEHLSLLSQQKTSGKIITNPNCSAIGITLALAPLMSLGTIEHVSIVTLQSISGAGYPGIPSMDILGNTIPHIEGEAEKISEEVKKILGTTTHFANFAVTTNVHRVPVLFGHTATLHITFQNDVDINKARAQYNIWNEKYSNTFLMHNKNGRPQAIRDLSENDMRIHIGHLKVGDQKNVLTLVALSHNLVRGAAGAVIANMESYLKLN